MLMCLRISDAQNRFKKGREDFPKNISCTHWTRQTIVNLWTDIKGNINPSDVLMKERIYSLVGHCASNELTTCICQAMFSNPRDAFSICIQQQNW